MSVKKVHSEQPENFEFSNDNLKKVQEILGLDVDGHFGKVTEARVMLWQNANGLEDDGIVGPETYLRMVLKK